VCVCGPPQRGRGRRGCSPDRAGSDPHEGSSLKLTHPPFFVRPRRPHFRRTGPKGEHETLAAAPVMSTTPLKRTSESHANATPKAEPWSRSTAERFGGYGSQYPSSKPETPRKTPKANKKPSLTEGVRYTTPAERANDATPSKSKVSATFASNTDRFTVGGNGSYLTSSSAPSPTAYTPSKQTKVPAATFHHASCTQAGERFGAVSIYGSSTPAKALPGVGDYDLTDRPGCGHESDASRTAASYTSRTDRFQTFDSHVVVTAAPGVGHYAPSDALQSARVRGAVKLQKAIRRRQSRGIFAQLEAESRQIPGPDYYAKQLQLAPLAARSMRSDPLAVPLAAKVSSVREGEEDEEAEVEKQVVVDAIDISDAPSPVVRSPPKGPLSGVVSLDMWLADEDDDDDNDGEEVAEEANDKEQAAPLPTRVEEPPEEDDADADDAADGGWLFSQLDRISAMTPSRVEREDYFDGESGWDVDGLRSDLKLYLSFN
jgi:hypothetical protein